MLTACHRRPLHDMRDMAKCPAPWMGKCAVVRRCRSLYALRRWMTHGGNTGSPPLRLTPGHVLELSLLSFSHFFNPGALPGLMASVGHSGAQRPQSMQRSG